MNKMKQTAMQQLLAQLKDERANIPMNKEWDRCYQAIEMVIQNIYLPMEKEQIKQTYLTCWKDYTGWDGKHWEMGTDPNETFIDYYKETYGK